MIDLSSKIKILYNGETLQAFPLTTGTKQGYPLHLLLYTTVLGVFKMQLKKENQLEV